MDKLKDIVKKYSAFDIDLNLDKTLNSNGNDTFISNKRVDERQTPISLLGGNNNQSQLVQQQPGPGLTPPSYNDIQSLQDGITSLQLIRFGLTNTFGQHATMKISNMLGADPTPYLMDEQNLKSLLLMSGATDSRAQYFINWLKTNAHYVSHPVGFLSYGNSYAAAAGLPPGQTNYYASQQQQPVPNTPYYGSADQIDEMDKFYYDIRVYQKGLPPNHPINRQNLEKYKEEKREEEQLKMIDRRTNIAMRTQMLKSFSMMGGEGQQHNNSLFSPEMMVMTGNARWEVVGKREDGSNIYQVVPNVGGSFNQSQMNGAATGQPMDQMTAMMTAMKSMMEMMQTIAKPNQTQESFFASIMQGISQKLFQQPASQIDDLSKAFEFFTKLKGPETTLPIGGTVPDPSVLIETKRMETDKDFGMRILDLKEKELTMKQQAKVEGEKDAANNINTLISGLQTVLPDLINVGKSLFLKGGASAGGVSPEGFAGPGMGGAPAETPIQTLIKMEYEKEKQRKQMEAERARRDWEEQVRRSNSEQQPRPETQRVVIQQPPEQVQPRPQPNVTAEDEAFFREETYLPYAPQALEEALRKADAQIAKLEKYKSTVGTVLQDKIANGENEAFMSSPPSAAEQQQPESVEEQQQKLNQKEDYLKYLDEVDNTAYDPDYTAEQQPPQEELEEEEEEKTLEVEKEEVDI
jgi:hypothetical protein